MSGDTDQQHWAQVQRELLLLLLGFLSRAVGSHGGILSRGGTGRHEFEGLGDCPPESCRLPLPSRERVEDQQPIQDHQTGHCEGDCRESKQARCGPHVMGQETEAQASNLFSPHALQVWSPMEPPLEAL